MFKINDFIETNLDERYNNPNVDFETKFTLTKCQHLPFHQAADYTVNLIGNEYKKIFLALSGGGDSEYMVRAFARSKVDFNVILVYTKLNNQELYYALKACQQLHIKPIILEIDEFDYFNTFYNDIHKPINGVSYHSTSSYIAGRYALDNDGILLTGDHHMDDAQNQSNIGMLEIMEGEFYNHILLPNSTICFYGHTLELLRSLAFFDLPNFDRFKCKHIYNIEERVKKGYSFTNNAIKNITQRISARNGPKCTSYPLSKKQFLDAT